jgi:hypothetical protein
VSGDLPGFAADQNLRLAQKMLEQQGEINELKAQRDKVLALHTEYEGRCTACVEYCNGDRDENVCTAGNVPWPCPTAAVYAESTPGGPS